MKMQTLINETRDWRAGKKNGEIKEEENREENNHNKRSLIEAKT